MKPLKPFFLAFFLVASLAGRSSSDFSSKLNIQEEDGSPSTFPWQLRVTNGSLTDNGDGTASLATGAGSGGGGSGSGTVNAANQFSLPYYSLVGSSNIVSGFAGAVVSTNTGVFISTFAVTSSMTVTGAVTISSTLPSGFFNSGGLSINNPNFGAGQWYAPILFKIAGVNVFSMGYESGFAGVGPGFYWGDANGSIYARLDQALTPSRFVTTDANKNLISYDLFNDSPTFNGQVSISNNQMLLHGTGASTKYVMQVPDATSLWIGPNPNVQSIYGQFNTFGGAGAGGQGAAGGFSTGWGNNACASVTTGQENSCFGYGSCANLTDGNYNVCFGPNSNPSNVHGSNITTIGGINACYFNTVDNALCIGVNSGVPGGTGTSQSTGLRTFFIGNFTGHFGGQWNDAGAIGYGAQVRQSNALQLGGLPGSGFEYNVMSTSMTIDYRVVIGSNAVLSGATFYQNSDLTLSSITASGQIALGNNQMITHGTGSTTKNVFQIPNGFSVWAGPNVNVQSVAGFADSFYGAFAGQAGASGADSTGMGYGACNAVSTGTQVTCLGSGAGGYTNGGNSDVFIGRDAGLQNRSGSRITAIGGVNTLYFGTGDDNIGLGAEAGHPGGGGTNLTTGSKNLLIGNYTGFSGGQYDNSMALGYGALVNASSRAQLGGLPGSGYEWNVKTTSITIDAGLAVSGNAIFPGTTIYQTSPVSMSSLTVVNQLVVPASAPYTTAGTLAYDSTGKNFVSGGGGIGTWGVIPRVIYSSTPLNDVLISTTITTTETAFLTQYTFPANYFSVGKQIRVIIGSEYVATATVPTFTFKLRFQKAGPTNVNVFTMVAGAPGATATYAGGQQLIATITGQTTGATGSLQTSTMQLFNGAKANLTPSQATIDTTAAQTLQWTATYGASSNNNYTRIITFMIEEIS